jgi:hypothetical protein
LELSGSPDRALRAGNPLPPAETSRSASELVWSGVGSYSRSSLPAGRIRAVGTRRRVGSRLARIGERK